MRQLVVYLLMSLDGVVEAPEQWVRDFDADMYQNMEDIVGRQDDVLLGRRMYEEWSESWPTASDEPFASFINGTPKHIATSSRAELAWENSTRVDGDVTEYVKELKQGAGRSIGVHGSITLARSLMTAGVVDELQLAIVPALAGVGRRLTSDVGQACRLSLIESTQSASGSLLVAYQVS